MRFSFSCVALVLVASGLACAKTSGSSPTNQNFDDCNDLVDGLTAAYIRCGHDEDTTRQEQLNDIVNGDCAQVTAIKDHNALQTVCLPSLKTIRCADLEAHTLDDSCKLQLIRPVPNAPP